MRIRRSKYNNRKTSVNGYLFDSAKEAKRYRELALMEKAKEIHNLKLQPEWDFKINGDKMFTYVADFSYETTVGRFCFFHVEDVKGFKTPVYRLKKKIIEACHGIKIVEI